MNFSISTSISRANGLGHRKTWTVFLLGLLAFLVFLPAVTFDFVNWDDAEYVYRNPSVLGGVTPSGLWYAASSVVAANWAPLTILSYQCDATLFGPGPGGFHFTNVLLHAVGVGLLYDVLVRMTGCPERSLVAVALFAVHPLRVESVAWVSERKDVLSFVMLMLALLAYERFCRRPTLTRYAVLFVTMILGLLAKSMLVTLPVLLLLLDVWPLGRLPLPSLGLNGRNVGPARPYPSVTWRQIGIEKIPLLVLSILFAAITLETQASAVSKDIEMPLWTVRIPNGIHATAWYLWKTIWPTGLHAIYVHPGIAGHPIKHLAASGLALGAVLGIAIAARQRVPAVPVGLAWFVVSLLPVIGVMRQQGMQSHADRYTYIPHIGLIMALVWGASYLARRIHIPDRVLKACAVAMMAICIVLTEYQAATWLNTESLWKHSLSIDPINSAALAEYGRFVWARGDAAAAESLYQQALAAGGHQPWMLMDLAVLRMAAGDAQGGIRYRDWACRLAPRDPEIARRSESLRISNPSIATTPPKKRHINPAAVDHINAGLRSARATNFIDALQEFKRAVQIEPSCAEALNNIGMVQSELGQYDAAEAAFRSAITHDAANPDYRVNLTRLLVRQKRLSEAMQQCDEALSLDPADIEAKTLREIIRKRSVADR